MICDLHHGSLAFYLESEKYNRTPIVAVEDISGEVHLYNSHLLPKTYDSKSTFFIKLKQIEECIYRPVIFVDRTQSEVQIIRDLFGLVPMYYLHIPGIIFAFSSSLASLISLPQLKPYLELNRQKINSYLTWLKDGDTYDTTTFYQNIFRLLPGKSLVINQDSIKINQFHHFDLEKWSDTPSKLQIAKKIRHTLQERIKKDIPEQPGKFLSQLSGGLDSSSICGLLRKCRPSTTFDTLYLDTDTDLTNEFEYAKEVADYINSPIHKISLKENHLEYARLHIEAFGHPEYMQNSALLNSTVLEEAHNLKCSVVFSGHPGDAIIGYGTAHLATLFENYKWKELENLIDKDTNLSETFKNSTSQNPKFKIIYSLIANQKSRLNKLQLTVLIYKASSYFKIPFTFFILAFIRKIKDKFDLPAQIHREQKTIEKSTESPTVSHNDYVNNTQLMAETDQFYAVYSEQIININEEFYILDHLYKIQHAFPFINKELFELSMTVPSEMKYAEGQRRGHLRAALINVIPERVRTRQSKANFGKYGKQAAIELFNQSQHLLANDEGVIWQYVSKTAFLKAKALLLKEDAPLYIQNRMQFYISRTIYLAIWLDHNQKSKFKSFF